MTIEYSPLPTTTTTTTAPTQQRRPSSSVRQLAIGVLTALMFAASIIFGEFPLAKYTPENSRDVFLLMKPTTSSSDTATTTLVRWPFSLLATSKMILHENRTENNSLLLLLLQQGRNNSTGGNVSSGKVFTSIRKLLVCTMLTNDFHNYAAGAAKMAHSIVSDKNHNKNDKQILWRRHLVHLDLGVLEMQVNCLVWDCLFAPFQNLLLTQSLCVSIQERPIPAKIWDALQELGWQKKFTRPRIKARHEEYSYHGPRFVDQFTKLHLWNFSQYDWVLYMDSDVFIVRSIVPMISFVLKQQDENNATKKKIWAMRDVFDLSDGFSMGTFMIRPSATEFDYLLRELHHGNKSFAEGWMEQGFLNAVYENQWGEIPIRDGGPINLAFWYSDRQGWRNNASHIQMIHFNADVKPWDWYCPWTEFAPLCYLFWNKDAMTFHEERAKTQRIQHHQ
jgi:hypothetical protein